MVKKSSSWIDYVKKVHSELKKSNPMSSFKDALVKASQNKKKGLMNVVNKITNKKTKRKKTNKNKTMKNRRKTNKKKRSNKRKK